MRPRTYDDIILAHHSSATMGIQETLQADQGRMSARPITEQEIKHELATLGIDVMGPESRKEETIAQALGAFSLFVLDEEQDKCHAIIEKHMGKSAGPLQGGSDEHEIYRVSITDDEDEAAAEMLKEFHTSQQGKRYATVLTMAKLEHYMLAMCDKRSRIRGCKKYTRLGNLMFILAFGPTHGQVRHIDNMDPNIQICLYMSDDCPSTVVYSMDGPVITNGSELVEYWGRNHVVPELVQSILLEKGDTALEEKGHTKYFAFWDTLNDNLKRFGKLYKPVALQLSLQTDPGTTLLAGGNEVHAGPPTVGPRMFAFAIGIPEEEDQDEIIEGEDNNGEVQYNSVLLHVDLCCILFSMMEFEYYEREEEHYEVKRFLLDLLFTLVKDYPLETYARLLGDDRKEVRDWLGKMVAALEDPERVNALLREAIESDTTLYSPDTGKSRKRWSKKKKRRNVK